MASARTGSERGGSSTVGVVRAGKEREKERELGRATEATRSSDRTRARYFLMYLSAISAPMTTSTDCARRKGGERNTAKRKRERETERP
jgi:hypothetical protein